jgi:hypothetical protein
MGCAYAPPLTHRRTAAAEASFATDREYPNRQATANLIRERELAIGASPHLCLPLSGRLGERIGQGVGSPVVGETPTPRDRHGSGGVGTAALALRHCRVRA